MQEYHQKSQKSPVDAHSRIMGGLRPRTRTQRRPRLLYAILILPLIMMVPTNTSAIGSAAMISEAVPERQYGSRIETGSQAPMNGCACSAALSLPSIDRTPSRHAIGATARWHRVLPASVRSRIGATSTNHAARCAMIDKKACPAKPALIQTMPPSAAKNGRQSVQLHTPLKS